MTKRSATRIPGDNWFQSKKRHGAGSIWLVNMHTDHWKHWDHDRWLTATDRPGTMFLYGTSSNNDRLSVNERSHHRAAGPPTKCELPLGLQWPAPAGR